MAIQASKANEAIQTIFDKKVNYVIPPYKISKSGINILIQGKMNHIFKYKGQEISGGNHGVLNFTKED